jgi:hypothetical protein
VDPDALDPFEDASLEDRSRPALRKGLVIGCAIAAAISAALALIGFIGLIALGLLMDEGRIPNSAAVPGRELTATTLDFLHSEGLLGEDERVLFFYGDGFLSVRADGNFFTDRRAVSYWEDDDEVRFEAAGYHEIEGVVFEPDDSLFANSVITIERVDGSQFGLVVSNEANKDEEFFELLDRTWKENR